MLSTLALWSRRRRQRREAAGVAARRAEYDARVARARHRSALVEWADLSDPLPVHVVGARRDPATRALSLRPDSGWPNPGDVRVAGVEPLPERVRPWT